MKWLLKELGRLIPAAERQAGQRPGMRSPAEARLPKQGQGQMVALLAVLACEKEGAIPLPCATGILGQLGQQGSTRTMKWLWDCLTLSREPAATRTHIS